jgi:hypothetical protein
MVLLQGEVSHAGVTVTLDGTNQSQTTSETGAYELHDVAPGTYTVTASLAGYETRTSAAFEVLAGESAAAPTLTLPRAKGGLSGTALLEGEDSHAGISVMVQGTSYATVTGATGAWSISHVAAGNYGIIAMHAGFEDATVSDQEVVAGQVTNVPTVTLSVLRSSISGTVTLEGAASHGGVNVVATAAWDGAISGSAATNSNGYYIIENLLPGEYRVEATKSGYKPGREDSVMTHAGELTANVSFTLEVSPMGTPSDLVEVSGGSQTGVVFKALAEPLAVKVLDSFGLAVAGTPVSFAVVKARDGGHVVTSEVLTDANGEASTTYVLGKEVGENRVTAGASYVPGVFVEFHATGEPDAPATVTVVSGDKQSGVIGKALAAPAVVRIEDQWGNETPGVEVAFEASGSGSTSPETATTNLFGQAQTTWTLGAAAGPQTLTVDSGAAHGSVGATGLHDAATALFKVNGDEQTGINSTTLTNPLVVEARDSHGNPVDGVQVSFSVTKGSGTLNPSATQTTNAAGRAQTTLTLGSLGSVNVTASATGLASVVFGATSVTNVPSRLVLVSGGGQEATVGTQLGSPFVVRVEDNYDNPVASATVHFVPKALSGTVGLVGAANVVTNAQGQAQTTFTLGTLAGTTAQWVEVTINDFPSVTKRSIPVSAEPDVPASITKQSGDAQTASYGQSLSVPLVVLVKDKYANPVWDEPVSWSSTTGGAVAPNPATTGSDGRAAVTATLGSTPGMPTQDFKATAGMVNVTFTATATGHWIEWIEPGRTWPGCPLDLEVEILGGGFDSDAVVIWDAGGAEQSLVPSVVESDRIVVTFTSDLFDLSGEIPFIVQQTAGGRCATYDFAVGSVLPDTGQRLCYNTFGEMSCPAESQDFWGQDAQFGWDLHITPAERFERTVPVANQPVVFDRLTQLEWQGCAAGQSGADCATGSASMMNWYRASGTADPTYNPGGATDTCGNLDWGGHTDWRLPSVKELSGIVDAGRAFPSIDGTAFPETPVMPFDAVWSSSSSAAYSTYAWGVNLGYGYVIHGSDKGSTDYARCVRGRVGPSDPGPFESLVLSGDRVVRDTSTGLTWQGCAAGQSGEACATGSAAVFEWQEALAYCASLDWGGYDDWRLPDRNELQSIVDYDRYEPAIDPAAFPATPSNYFWSSSSYVTSLLSAWVVYFFDGYVNGYGMSDTKHARCVRGRVGP